jgi:hypothetical protein
LWNRDLDEGTADTVDPDRGSVECGVIDKGSAIVCDGRFLLLSFFRSHAATYSFSETTLVIMLDTTSVVDPVCRRVIVGASYLSVGDEVVLREAPWRLVSRKM